MGGMPVTGGGPESTGSKPASAGSVPPSSSPPPVTAPPLSSSGQWHASKVLPSALQSLVPSERLSQRQKTLLPGVQILPPSSAWLLIEHPNTRPTAPRVTTVVEVS